MRTLAYSPTTNSERANALGEPAPPLEERIPLLPLQLHRSHLPRPSRSSGHLQPLLVLALLRSQLGFLLRSEEVGIVRGGVQGGVRDDLDVLAFCGPNEVNPGVTGESGCDSPAEKSVSASCAVLRNSSRSFS